MTHRRLGYCAVGIVLLLGCDSRRGLAPASGVVLVDGKPVGRLSVVFYPAEGRAAAGVTDEQGRFQLTTFKANDGAAVGEHVITVTPMLDPPIFMPADLSKIRRPANVKIPTIAKEYLSRSTTGLKATVTVDGPNEFTLKVTSK